MLIPNFANGGGGIPGDCEATNILCEGMQRSKDFLKKGDLLTSVIDLNNRKSFSKVYVWIVPNILLTRPPGQQPGGRMDPQ